MKKERNWKLMRLIVTLLSYIRKNILLNNKCATTGYNYYFPSCRCMFRGFIKFLCRRSVGFFSRAFLVFLMKESKKRRRQQLGKLMAKVSFTAGQFARCPALNEPPVRSFALVGNNIFIIFNLLFLVLYRQSVRYMKLVPKTVRLR